MTTCKLSKEVSLRMFYKLCLCKSESVMIESKFVMACQNLFSDFAIQCNSKAVPRQIITFDKNKKSNNEGCS